MAEVNFGNDGDFSDKAMIQKCNTNLANEFGNLCQRTLSMVFKNCGKQVPTPGDFMEEDEALLNRAKALQDEAATEISEQAILKYVQHIVELVWEANKYIDEMAPWALKKTDPDRMATVLYVILEVLRYTAIVYQPVIPSSANRILDQLTVPTDERTFAHLVDDFRIQPGATISKPQGIFPRIETPELIES